MEEKQHKKAIWAWTMYDWANSAFVTTIMAAVLPVYYTSVAAAGLAPNIATAYWGFTSSISALIAAIISPVLGAVADFTGCQEALPRDLHGVWCDCHGFTLLCPNRRLAPGITPFRFWSSWLCGQPCLL